MTAGTPQQPGRRHAPRETPRRTAFETTLIVGGVVLFLFMLFEMHDPPEGDQFLSPPLIAAAGTILLWPLRNYRTVRALLFSGAFLLVLWFFDKLVGILVPFVVVYLLAFLFDPVVAYLERRFRFPRWASALCVTAVIVGLIALVVLLLVPSIVDQLGILAGHLLDSISYVREWLATTTLLDKLEDTGLVDKQTLISQLTVFIQEKATTLAAGIPNAAQRLLQSISSLIGLITILTILPVILYYTLKDYPVIKRRLIELFTTFGGRKDHLVKAGGIVGNYLRGLLTISAIAAFNVSVALILFNVPFALLIGLLAGLLNLIPNLGAIITNIIAVLIAVLFGDPWYFDALIVVAVLFGQSLLESTVLTPNILSQHVGLHPVLILLSLFGFGSLMGLFGLLIAVPTTALIMTIYRAYRDEKNGKVATVENGK